MPSTYSSNLRLELQAVGENNSTWGTIANTVFSLLEASITSVASISMASDANYTLTTNNGSSDEARCAILEVASVSLSATRDIIIPGVDKWYIVYNNTTGGQSIRIKTSGGTGITIPNGKRMMVYCDGTNTYDAINNLPSGTTIGGAIVLTGSLCNPNSNDGAALGASGTAWSDLFLASGGVINWNAGDVTLTHAANLLTGAGGQFVWNYGAAATTAPIRVVNSTDNASNLGLSVESDRATMTDGDLVYIDLKLSDDAGNQDTFARISAVSTDVSSATEDGFLRFSLVTAGAIVNYLDLTATALLPVTNDVLALGSATLSFSDLFLASGGVINFANGDVTITHSANLLSFAGASSGYAFDGPIELGHATDTTLSRVSAGVLGVEGIPIGDQPWVVACSDETTTITTGTNKATFVFPYNVTVVSVGASLNTASTSGAVTVDINESGTTILSTKITIDQDEKTSLTAATPAVISDAAIAAGNEVGIDIDGAGTGAKGLKVWLIVRRTS